MNLRPQGDVYGPNSGENGKSHTVLKERAMEISPDTRKPVDRLTPNDFSAFPIWEYALDEEGIEGRDETWVRPLTARVVPRGQYSLQVAADFKAASGRSYSGFLNVTTAEESVEIGGGVILYGSNYLPIPIRKMFSFEKLKEVLLSRLGLSEAEVLPITYTLRVPIEGEQALRSGKLTSV